jgi:scyllo-inositol 2-dehydrogenase (NADP+)
LKPARCGGLRQRNRTITSPIRVGILGLGRSGWNIHADALRTMPDRFRIVAVADPLADRAAACGRDADCAAYVAEEDLWADKHVELVVVASPNLHHSAQSQRALKAGKHVLCEKPFGPAVADVDAMITAARLSGKVLLPFQQRRYEPDFRKVEELCRSGIFGDLQFIRICWHGFKRRWDWQTLTSMAGGALNNNGPHPIDHALELYGDGEPDVWCQMRRCLCSGDAEDFLKIILTGPGKPMVEVELMDAVAYPQDRWLVCGTAGGLRGDAVRLEWRYVDLAAMGLGMLKPRSTTTSSAATWIR